MPKRKVERTPEEEEVFLKEKRAKNAARQRAYQQKIRNNTKTSPVEQTVNYQSVINVDIPHQSSVNPLPQRSNLSQKTKKRVDRTPEEEEVFQREKRAKNAERQRAYRLKMKNKQTTNYQSVIDLDTPLSLSSNTTSQSLNSHIIEVPETYSSSIRNETTITGSVEKIRSIPVVHNINHIPSNDITADDINEHYIGPMNIICMHCNAKHFEAEKVAHKKNSFNDCCSHGEVVLDPLPEPPQILQELFNGTHEKSHHFRERIRSYNSSFAFASFNANLVDFNNRRPGPWCFKIQGQIYYQINTSLYAAKDENPAYGQLFIIDQNEAVDVRCQQNSTLDSNLTQSIDRALRQCNIFAKSFQMMHEELQSSMIDTNAQTTPEMQLLFSLKPGMDHRRYNPQRVNEVAAIFTTTADGDIPESYISIRDKNTKELQYVSSMDENVEPWIYPLFYPHGTRGWRDGLTYVNKKGRLSRSAYVKYLIAVRDNNIFLQGGRLFQQYVVDMYVKIERDRTNYCRLHQKELRADTYQGLIDHLEQAANIENTQVGKIIILPSSFTGSPRNMLQHYYDSMALVQYCGKPDLFITMTCNPNWREIQENLLPGQTAADRPDLVSRVFNIKKNELMKEIVKNKLFGEVEAFVNVQEYQKRLLPHVHILVVLKRNSKITTPEIVNKFISAEIPKREDDSILHDIVLKNMIHGPCGDWCFNDKGECTKHFPKQFQEETTMDNDGYPTYMRRNTGSYQRSNGTSVDNQYVVPYNPTLLKKFNCHINVEIVSTIKAVKYIYKYIYKGHDAASVTITDSTNNETIIEHDEIRNFIDSRYVGSVEACDRIWGRQLQDKSHSIIRLPIHLPNEQSVVFSDGYDENAIRAALEKQTMLTDYFALNRRDPDACQYTYAEIPTHYVFKKNTQTKVYSWEKRKTHFNVIGRMYSVSPTQIQLYHLRLLLITVKGAQSFEDLRTVDGVIHNDYQSACLALGLIEDDAEWNRAMTEGETWMMPRQLRNLFVRILIFCEPANPRELWENFKDAMSEDFKRHHEIAQAHRKAFIEISRLLSRENLDIRNFDLPQLTDFEIDINDNNDENNTENSSTKNHKIIGESQYQKLNDQQKAIVDRILQAVISHETITNSCFYIDGPGGSGKTFIYTTLYHLLKNMGKTICTMAFTGIAAILLPHGKTVHKTFNMPVPILPDSVSNFTHQSKGADYLKQVDVFIWDEAPMAPRHALELVDRALRDFMNVDVPFGGKIIILGGDFRQLLPVKPHATRCEMINLSIKFSRLWNNFLKCSLTENMRTLPQEIEFAKFLLAVGDGTVNDNNNNLNLPNKCIAQKNTNIVQETFGELIRNRRYDAITKTVILSARNIDVEEINRRVVELLDKNTERIYTSVDNTKNCDNGNISDGLLPEYLNTLNPPNFPPYELRLRINCIVMLIRNLSINEGLCNGTRLQVLELTNNLLRCRILTGDKAGQIVFINRIQLICENVYPFTFRRRQFPIKLAFAMTINKSQGQTFDTVGIDLRKDVFNHGQLYVALSRVRSWDSLKIYLGDQRNSNAVKNYVFTELYQ